MNERYLFKGKRVDNGEWVGGYLIQRNKTYIMTVRVINCMVVPASCMASVELVEVITETVGQCTGLRDKKGRLIFEGDICSLKYCRNNHVGKIVFGEEAAAFILQYNITVGAYGERATHRPLIMHCDDVEVIGNIHDNPELLEVEK